MALTSYGPSGALRDYSQLQSDIQEVKELFDNLQFPSYDEITKEVVIRLQ